MKKAKPKRPTEADRVKGRLSVLEELFVDQKKEGDRLDREVKRAHKRISEFEMRIALAATPPALVPGARVNHRTYGLGRLHSVNHDDIAIVEWDGGRTNSLPLVELNLAEFAK